MKITETCRCGARFDMRSRSEFVLRVAAAEWRTEHKHAEAEGICGHWPGRTGVEPCELLDGHTGQHQQGDSHWPRVEFAIEEPR